MAVLVLGTPLPNLVVIGMEHVAQTFSVLLLVVLSIEVLSNKQETAFSHSREWLLCGSAVLAGMIRYEAVFAVAPIFVLLWLRKHRVLALPQT